MRMVHLLLVWAADAPLGGLGAAVWVIVAGGKMRDARDVTMWRYDARQD